MTESDVNGLLSVNSAAACLGIGRSKIYELLGTEQLRSVTIGRRRLVPAQELERFIAELTKEADMASVRPT